MYLRAVSRRRGKQCKRCSGRRHICRFLEWQTILVRIVRSILCAWLRRIALQECRFDGAPFEAKPAANQSLVPLERHHPNDNCPPPRQGSEQLPPYLAECLHLSDVELGLERANWALTDTGRKLSDRLSAQKWKKRLFVEAGQLGRNHVLAFGVVLALSACNDLMTPGSAHSVEGQLARAQVQQSAVSRAAGMVLLSVHWPGEKPPGYSPRY
jgi:hypothetical protein